MPPPIRRSDSATAGIVRIGLAVIDGAAVQRLRAALGNAPHRLADRGVAVDASVALATRDRADRAQHFVHRVRAEIDVAADRQIIDECAATGRELAFDSQELELALVLFGSRKLGPIGRLAFFTFESHAPLLRHSTGNRDVSSRITSPGRALPRARDHYLYKPKSNMTAFARNSSAKNAAV